MDMLSSLYSMAGAVTRQVNAENPTGGKGAACGCESTPNTPGERLGTGWKTRPFFVAGPGETITVADIDGPGIVNEIFLTLDAKNFSEVVLRIYWDGEETPSVECPAGAFFCMGFDRFPHVVASLPVVVAPKRGMNCYWQMPFRRHAHVTLANEGEGRLGVVACRVLYRLVPVGDDVAYFHAQYRRDTTSKERPEHVILDGVKGKGLYVGTYLMWNALSSGWWGEGEVKFYLDGDAERPTICDNGTEDYFGGAWGFGYDPDDPSALERTFCAPFLGMPLAVTRNPDGPRKFGLYRWHVLDPIGFGQDIRATVQALGWYPDGHYRPLTDDIASVAYWYQLEPHVPFPPFPPVEERWDR